MRPAKKNLTLPQATVIFSCVPQMGAAYYLYLVTPLGPQHTNRVPLGQRFQFTFSIHLSAKPIEKFGHKCMKN